jgi:WD40 repeat protein
MPPGSQPSFSADGTRLAVGTFDGVAVYDRDGASVATLPGSYARAVLNHDGRLLVVWEDCNACADPPVVWDVAARATLFPLGGDARRVPTNVVASSPTADLVATGDKGGVVRVFDLANPGAPLAELHGHTNEVTSVAFSRDGKLVVSGSLDGTTRVWEYSFRTSTSLRGHVPPVAQATFDDSGGRVATIHHDESVRIWDTAPFLARSAPAFGGGADYGRLDDAGDRSLRVMDDGDVVVRDTATARTLLRLQSPGGRFDAAISGDGRSVLVASADGRSAKIWDVAAREARTRLRGAGDMFRHPALDASGTRAVTTARRSVRIWDARSGALAHTLPVPGLIDASFSPDGRVVALVTEHGGSLWNVSSGERVARLQGTGDEFRRPQFSPDGRLLATVTGEGHAARVWDTDSGELRRAGFSTGSGPLESRVLAATAFSEDSRQLLTVYDFGELRVWDTASGQLLVEPPSQVFSRMNTVLDVAFNDDRTRVTQLNDNAALATYRCLLCASTGKLLEVGDRRVSESVRRNASQLSLQ